MHDITVNMMLNIMNYNNGNLGLKSDVEQFIAALMNEDVTLHKWKDRMHSLYMIQSINSCRDDILVPILKANPEYVNKILMATMGYYSAASIIGNGMGVDILSSDELDRIPMYYNNLRLWLELMRDNNVVLPVYQILKYLDEVEKIWIATNIPVNMVHVREILDSYPNKSYPMIETLFKALTHTLHDITILYI
jgi:hypothetical protein